MQQEQAAYVRTSQRFNFIDDDDDDEYSFATQEYLKKFSSAITLDLPKSDSLIMEDKHLDTIPATESDELIKSSVVDLVHTPSKSDGISESEYDFPICDDSSPKKVEVLDDIISIPPGIVEADFDPKGDIRFIENLIDNDSFYSDDIDYVEASPPDSELVWLRGGGDLLSREIEALKDNPTPSFDFVTKSSSTSLNFFLEETNTFDNSLPESKTFCFNLEEISSGSPTSYLDLSLPYYEALFCDSEPDSGNFAMDVVEDIFDNPTREPRVYGPNVLPTHPALHLDSDFTLSSDSLGSDLAVSFPSGTRNKIFDPGIFIEVQSKKFISQDEFSISFIRDPLSPVIDTLLLFLFENEDNVFNLGILASNEEKSPHLLSHRDFKDSISFLKAR
ncbi:hypothetical protein Tco_1391214 [Tanacetum coccineum]